MPKSPQKFTFIQYRLTEWPTKFLMVRCVDDMATHYMNPKGMWIAWPDDDELIETIMSGLVATGDLPEWEPPK